MKKPFPLPDNNLGQRCTNVKGTMKDSNQCRIYVKNGCQHFVDRLKMATNSPNFSIKRISHRKPPMIIAYMKADTVHEVYTQPIYHLVNTSFMYVSLYRYANQAVSRRLYANNLTTNSLPFLLPILF